MTRRLLLALLAAALALAAAPARADVPDENEDDAPAGTAVPLVCVPHPTAAPGSRLCEGFLMSRIPEDAAGVFDAALDVSLAVPPGLGPFPLLVQVHGYGLDKGSPDLDYRVVREGIAFLRYSTRGFGRSFGDNQLADEDYEIRDIQNLVRQVVERTAFALPPPFSFDRGRIAVAGESYGGGHSLLLAQSARRTWPCGPDVCRLVTAVPIATWTDLVYSLIPNGRPASRVDDPGYVFGIEKLTYLSALYFGGLRADPRYGGTSYPPFFHRYYAFVSAGEPYQDAQSRAFPPHVAATAAQALRTLTLDRSPAYQDYCTAGPLPIFMVQAWTDDLFTAQEAVRLRDVLDRQCGSPYPLKLYLGNSGHQRALLDDLGEQEHVLGLVRTWLRHHLLGEGPAPAFDVTSGVTHPPGEPFDPGAAFTVAEIEDMQRGVITADFAGGVRLTHSAGVATVGDLQADPIVTRAAGGRLGVLGGIGGVVETAGPTTRW